MSEQTGFEEIESQEEQDQFVEVDDSPDAVGEGVGPVSAEPDGIPRSGGVNEADFIPGTPVVDPLQAPQSDPNLQMTQQNMQRYFTQRTQELAEKERQLNERLGRADKQFQSLVDLQKANQPPEQSRDILKHLPSAMRAGMSQEATVLMESVGAIVKGEIDSFKDEFALQQQQQSPELLQRLQRMEEQTQAAQQAQRQQAWRAEAQQLQNEMGPETFNAHVVNVGQVLTQYPNLSVRQAFAVAAPQAYDQHLMEKGRKEALTNITNKQRANAAHLQGGGAAQVNAQPQGAYRPGESMAESVNALTGGAM